MPELGVGPGKIVKWYKQPGDIVRFEDVLCDIETKDFTFGMEVEDEELGIMGQIIAAEGSEEEVEENEVIATVYHRPPPTTASENEKETRTEETDENRKREESADGVDRR